MMHRSLYIKLSTYLLSSQHSQEKPMEKTSNIVDYTKKESQPSILKEAFKITIKNGTLVLFIASIMFSIYFIMVLADYVLLSRVIIDFVIDSRVLPKNASIDSHPTLYKALFKDLRSILVFIFVEWSFWCLTLMFSVAASVHSTNEAYTAKPLGLKDMLTGLRGKIKRALKTTIWMILISFASAALLFLALGVGGIMAEGPLPANLIRNVLTCYGFYYLYVLALWMLSLVVSVLEENMSGLKAIYQANELMKGKRLKGYGLMVLLILVTAIMHMIFASLEYLVAGKKAELVVWAIKILSVWPYCLMELFVFAVYTLFYHECKKSHQEKEIANQYAPVPAIAEV